MYNIVVKSYKKLIPTVSLLIVLVGVFWIFINLQSVIDWWRLRGYEPSVQISQLATDASFNEEGRRLFYVYYPELLDKPNFQGKCNTGEETIVLGCYISQEKIYVFDVDDERLDGVEEVTAAHEMLHVVYERLSNSEKEKIDKLTNDFYESTRNARLDKTIESYRSRDPSVVQNELHSILGTEFRNLPKELEDHYSRYFINRLSVVALAEAYETEFTSRENKIEVYDAQLKELSASIDQQETQLTLLGSSLTDEKNQLENLRGDIESYNAAVPVFNQKVRDYNNQLESLRADINRYNEIVAARNVIAVQEQELVEAIDNRVFETE
jgi:uncharacterized protein YukE